MDVKIFQLHKRSVYVFDKIQDQYNINLSKNALALATGFPYSYQSKEWARSLVDSFVANPELDPIALSAFFTSVGVEKQADGLATFMGIQIHGALLSYITSGAIAGFHIHKDQTVTPFPHKDITELEEDHVVLGRHLLPDASIAAQQFRKEEINLKWEDKIVLSTHALAKLLMEDKNVMTKLLSLNSFEEFFDYIMELWRDEKLAEDDITFCIIEPLAISASHLYLPPEGFSFPKDTPKEQRRNLQEELARQQSTIAQLKKQKKRIRYAAICLFALLTAAVGYLLFSPSPTEAVVPAPTLSPIVAAKRDSLESYKLALYKQDSLLQQGNLAELPWELKTAMLRPEASLDLHISRQDSLIGTIHLVGISQADTTELSLPTLKVKNIEKPSSLEKTRLKSLLLTKNKSVKKLKIYIEETNIIFTFPDKSQKSIPLAELIEGK